jgi:hypothetical protein
MSFGIDVVTLKTSPREFRERCATGDVRGSSEKTNLTSPRTAARLGEVSDLSPTIGGRFSRPGMTLAHPRGSPDGLWLLGVPFFRFPSLVQQSRL